MAQAQIDAVRWGDATGSVYTASDGFVETDVTTYLADISVSGNPGETGQVYFGFNDKRDVGDVWIASTTFNIPSDGSQTVELEFAAGYVDVQEGDTFELLAGISTDAGVERTDARQITYGVPSDGGSDGGDTGSGGSDGSSGGSDGSGGDTGSGDSTSDGNQNCSYFELVRQCSDGTLTSTAVCMVTVLPEYLSCLLSNIWAIIKRYAPWLLIILIMLTYIKVR